MKTLIVSLGLILGLSGCATEQYAQYAKSYEASAVAQANALRAIAESGSDTAKVAAVMALVAGQNSRTLQAPQNEALQWASILIPSLTQAYGIAKSADVAMNSSNNAALVANGTNAAFISMAGKIQAPAANVTTTLSGTGNLGSGTYSTLDNHTVTPAPVVVAPSVIPPVVVVNDTSTVTTSGPVIGPSVGP
jgi:hypothetical protein